MAEQNIKLIIEYDGTAYSGWQTQKENRSVQSEIINAIKKITDKDVSLVGAGRTDAGVHAYGQTANFIIDHSIEPAKYRDAINHFLPDDIFIHNATEVPLDFHSRRDAVSKLYRYRIGLIESSLERNRRWHYGFDIDFELLTQAAAFVEGEHDFAAFCVVASRQENNVCRIERAEWQQSTDELIFEIVGNRFLHNMVRVLVGGMINLATVRPDQNSRNLTLESFADILNAPGEGRIEFTAPSRGLYLVSVQYDKGSDE